MRIRIKDIADKAGVSVGTVDRVIHKRGNVSSQVKAKVERVMTELGYRRNIIASTLAYNRTLRIAVLIFDNGDYYWEQTRLGIERAQEATHHYGVQIQTYYCSDPNDFEVKSEEILNARPDAVLFAPIYREQGLQFIKRCQDKSLPVVLINTEVDAPEFLCYIGQDSYQSGVVAARLINFGIPDNSTALLVNLDTSAASAQHLVDKERGFRDFFDEEDGKSVRIVTRNLEHNRGRKQIRAFLDQLFEEYPDLSSMFITNSRAYLIIDCLTKKELDRLFIVGFDLIEPNIKHLKANRIQFLINQNPVLQGYLGILNIVNHALLKQDVTPIQYLPLDIVVVENCDYYLNAMQAFPTVI